MGLTTNEEIKIYTFRTKNLAGCSEESVHGVGTVVVYTLLKSVVVYNT